MTLVKRGRRCVHLHLPDNSGVTLRQLAQVVDDVIADILTDRAWPRPLPWPRTKELAEATVVVEAAEASETAVEAEFAEASQDADAEAVAAEVAAAEGEASEA